MLARMSSEELNINPELLSLLSAVILDIGGKAALDVVLALLKKKEATDEELVQMLKMKANEVRKILYLLHNYNIAIYRRVRDEETGWYTYFWRINLENIKDLVIRRKREVLKKLKERLEYERSGNYYYCPNHNLKRYKFEEAMENYFECPVCKSPLVPFDNSQMIKVLEIMISKLEKDLESVRSTAAWHAPR